MVAASTWSMATSATASRAHQGLIVKLILMTVQVTLVSMESVWMALIATVVSAHQDSQGRDVTLTSMSVPPIPVARVQHVSTV